MLALGILVIILKEYFHEKIWWKPSLGILALVWIAVLAYATIFSRPAGEYGPVNLIPFHSYREVNSGGSWEILLSNYMNILLFFPGGLFTSAFLPKRWHWVLRVFLSTVFFMILSAGLEYIQYCFLLGRVEADDVLHNALGALLGSIFGIIPPPRSNHERG